MDREPTASEDVVLELLELVKRKHDQEFSSTDETGENFRMLREELEAFLWKICLRESSDPQAAAAAVHLAREALFDQKTFSGPRSRFLFWWRGKPWQRYSPRFWLFDTARKFAKEIAANPAKISAVQVDVIPPKDISEYQGQPTLKQLSYKECHLRRSRKTRQIWREGDCSGGCDILFLHKEGFKIREMAKGMQLGKSVVHDYVSGCLDRELALRQKNAPPAPTPMVKTLTTQANARQT